MAGRRWEILIPGIAVAMGAALLAWEPAPLVELRLKTFDFYQQLRPRDYVPTPVRILDVDDESLHRIGQWPWPRHIIADLVDRVTGAGASVLALDAIFAEPDRSSPARLLADLPSPPDAMVEWLRSLPDDDRLLAAAIARGRVVTGFALTSAPGGAPPALKAGWALAGDKPGPFVASYTGSVADLGDIEGAAAGNGSINLIPDRDEVVRAVPLIVRRGDQLYPSLVAEIDRVLAGKATFLVKSSGASGVLSLGRRTGIAEIRLGNHTVKTDRSGQMLLYDSGPVAERTIPAWRVLDEAGAVAGLTGTIVLLGTSATALADIRATPIRAAVPGVELHAEAIEQLLTGVSLRRPDWAPGAELAFLAITGLAIVFGLPRIGPGWGAVVIALAAGLSLAGAWWAFAGFGLLLAPVYPALILALVYMSSSLLRHLRTEAEKRQVRSAFGRYVAPEVVAQLTTDPGRLRLGGDRREMTFLFCDIHGFTAIAEQFRDTPEALIGLVNDFLTPMSEAIHAHRGTIDKYIGDCIMAFWNAPLADDRHAVHACRAALDMIAALARLNRESEDRPRLKVGIGINTGPCIVGNMGSKHRFDYSVIGDAVNLAARLESATRGYGVDIIVSEETARRAPGLALLELDLVSVKGKREATRIHALFGDADPAFTRLRDLHDLMLTAYRRRDWDGACDLVAACRALRPDLDGLYAMYRHRIDAFRRQPPPADWRGVHVAETK